MAKTMSASLDARGRRFALVAGRFNEFITQKLVHGATDAILRCGGADDAITLVWTPGSFEIPQVARRLAKSGNYDAVVTLGCLIRGDTAHFDLIASACVSGISAAAVETGVPITLGVITVNTMEQAIDRAGGKHGNKGADAAIAAIEMASLFAALSASGKGRK